MLATRGLGRGGQGGGLAPQGLGRSPVGGHAGGPQRPSTLARVLREGEHRRRLLRDERDWLDFLTLWTSTDEWRH